MVTTFEKRGVDAEGRPCVRTETWDIPVAEGSEVAPALIAMFEPEGFVESEAEHLSAIEAIEAEGAARTAEMERNIAETGCWVRFEVED